MYIAIIKCITLVDTELNAVGIDELRAVARKLIGGVYIHIFRFCPTNFF